MDKERLHTSAISLSETFASVISLVTTPSRIFFSFSPSHSIPPPFHERLNFVLTELHAPPTFRPLCHMMFAEFLDAFSIHRRGLFSRAQTAPTSRPLCCALSPQSVKSTK